MSNLYEMLEVSEKASKEVIDKAYHVLVKKYHPDLQQGEEKQKAEEKMKQINEAYEILSNEEKRKEREVGKKLIDNYIKYPLTVGLSDRFYLKARADVDGNNIFKQNKSKAMC